MLIQKQEHKFSKNCLKNFIIQQQIGHGASGVCYKALSKLNSSVCALKKISINAIKGNSLKMALKQVEVLKQLTHPNIIKYYDSFIEDGYLYIVMQYAAKGDLHAMLKKRKIKNQHYEQAQIWDMARQLLQALKYLHSKNIVHRDFKTLNIFIGEKNNLLVGDLGVSKIIKNDIGLYSRVGTPLYLAPQIIKYEKYDFKADVWGFGCVMYVMAALCHPFQGKNIISLGQNILHSDPKPISLYSNQLNSFIRNLLQKNPAKRPDAKNLLANYFSPQMQKQRCVKSNLGSSKDIMNQNKNTITIRNIDKGQYDKRQSSNPREYKNYTYGGHPDSANNSNKKIEKHAPIYMNIGQIQIQLKNQKNQSKKQKTSNNINDQKINHDETIILQPSSRKIQGHQQKTRVRALFNHPRSRQVTHKLIQDRQNKNQYQMPKYSPLNCSDIQNENGAQENSKKFIDNYKSCLEDKKKLQSPVHSSRYKPQIQKVQTQAHQLIKKQSQNNNFIKHRSIQSAKPKTEVDSFKRPLYSSSQKIQKPLVITSVSRMFFESQAQNFMASKQRRVTNRPKSSIGRKPLIGNNQIRYVRKRDGQQQYLNDVSHTKTQILRKPQMIII